MLMGEMTRVGIAAVEVNGLRYWVQEFASDPTGETSAPTGPAGWEQRGGKWVYRKADGSGQLIAQICIQSTALLHRRTQLSRQKQKRRSRVFP